MFRLLTMYQPGGEDEKFKILQNLQAPTAESEAAKAVSSLRAWSKWLRPCRELHIQAPDPSLLARGLTNMVRAVLDKSQDATFRTSLVKSTLQIDTNPSYDKVDSYFKHLMAEREALAVAATSSTTTVQLQKPEARLRPARADRKGTQPTSPTTNTQRTTSPAPTNSQRLQPGSHVSFPP